MSPAPIERIIARYFDAWNERDLAARAGLLSDACAPRVAYVDPKHTCDGVAELAARIQLSHDKLPGLRVRVTTVIDGYGDHFRYTWAFVAARQGVYLSGLDVVARADDGRIGSLTSFFSALVDLPRGEPLKLARPWGATARSTS
ncbi:MAG TPA: nuclear transport factor 2 family protein [Byssovorax sp.]|jgi:hypothetical protein